MPTLSRSRQSTPKLQAEHPQAASSKQCSCCGEIRPSKWFSPGRGPSGLHAWCRPCSAYFAMRNRERKRLECDPQQPAAEKECCTCSRTLPADSFVKDVTSNDGLHSYCKECASKAQKARRANRAERSADQLSVAPASQERICSVCRALKPWSEFHKVSYSVSGIDYRCKKCNADLSRQQRNQKKQQKQELLSASAA